MGNWWYFQRDFEKYAHLEILYSFSVHAAVIAINEAIEKGVADQTIITLKNPNAMLVSVEEDHAHAYQNELSEAKKRKEENARLKVK